MSALGGPKPAGGSTGIAPVPALVSLVIFVIIFAVMYMFGGSLGMTALIGIVIGGLLIGFGVHFVPVGGAPAAMGQAPGIATGVAMLAAGGGLAGLFGGAWAASQGTVVAVVTGAIGGGLMLAITCFFVNFIYIYGMGIPAASGKVKKDPITGDSQPEYKSQGTEGHGLPFVSFVGGVIGGILGGAGGTLIYDPSYHASPIYGLSYAASPMIQVVPEPSTLALLGVGMISLLGYAWRKRKPA